MAAVFVVLLGLAAAILTAIITDRPVATRPLPRLSSVDRRALPDELSPLRTTAADPTLLRPLTHDEAEARNAAVPVATSPLPAAAAFTVPSRATLDWARALDCLTASVYYEAASEPLDGQRAVAQVVLNRVRHPVYPHTVCGVVFQGSSRTTGCQFTFSCDGALRRAPIATLWNRAQGVAAAALGGYVYRPVGTATHYHTVWVVPYWESSLVKLATLGAHIFYRWPGTMGLSGAFSTRYAGGEPAIAWRGGFGQPERTLDEPLAVDGSDAPVGPAIATGRPTLRAGDDRAAPGTPPAPYVPATERRILGPLGDGGEAAPPPRPPLPSPLAPNPPRRDAPTVTPR